MQKSTAPAGHGLDPQTPAATHRSTASTLGNLPHSILAREVMRLKEARDVVLRGGGGGILEQAEALRNEIAQIELQAQADTIALAQEVSHVRELLLEQREEEEDAESGLGKWQWQAAPAHPDPAPGSKEENRADAAFVSRLLDVKDRLHATSVEHASPSEMMPPHIYWFLHNSSSRIRVIMDRISNIEATREVHRETKRLMRENAELRIMMNDYTEGLLVEAGKQLSVGKEAAPSTHPSISHSVVRGW